MDFNDYVKTYENLSKQVGGMVLTNEIASRPLEHTNEVVFHDEELELYI